MHILFYRICTYIFTNCIYYFSGSVHSCVPPNIFSSVPNPVYCSDCFSVRLVDLRPPDGAGLLVREHNHQVHHTHIVKEHSHDQIHVYMHTHINDHTHYHHTTIHMTIHTTIYTTIYTTIHKTAHTTITRPYTRLYKRLYTGLYDRTYLLTYTRPGIRPYTRTYGHTHGYYIKSYIWPYTPYSRTHITHGVDTLHSAIHT